VANSLAPAPFPSFCNDMIPWELFLDLHKDVILQELLHGRASGMADGKSEISEKAGMKARGPANMRHNSIMVTDGQECLLDSIRITCGKKLIHGFYVHVPVSLFLDSISCMYYTVAAFL
jgi:hypothetical protein